MALFELEQDFGSDPETEWKAPTFKDCAAADIDLTFFEQDEHADLHTVDGKEADVYKRQGEARGPEPELSGRGP